LLALLRPCRHGQRTSRDETRTERCGTGEPDVRLPRFGCRPRGLDDETVRKAHIDRGVSGFSEREQVHRDGCIAALNAVALGETKTLVVWKLDRLGRTVRQLVDLAADFAARGVSLRSLTATDFTDTSTPAGKFFFHVMAALAEMERGLIRERTLAGLAAARARGRKGGRRPSLSPAQVAQARLLMADRSAVPLQIAATFGISRSTLYRVTR